MTYDYLKDDNIPINPDMMTALVSK